ncbi:MAG: class I SAM-dependent methyltransferase [Deltaproteobacteria bacterium]|jgi:SAM-dependent methyltransferase|nr:class I SAM-dependent methyltransferase [Deltaproteobacteria bacterium]
MSNPLDLPLAGSSPRRAGNVNPYESEEFLAAFPEGLRPGGLEITKKALAYCQFPLGAYLVDVGCGPGVTLEFLSQEGFRVLGLDSSEKLLKLASLKGPTQKASFTSLPLAAGVADGLFCECVLSLARDKAQVLGEFRRVIKLEGFLVLSDLLVKTPTISPKPALTSPAEPLTCASGALTYPALKALIEERGFKVTYFEDCHTALKSLAASLVWRYGSLSQLKTLFPSEGLGCLDGGKNLTYGLLVAQAVA